MAQSDASARKPAASKSAPAEPVTRDLWLSAGQNLAEEWLDIEGLGRVLVSEITAKARADIMTIQSTGLLTDVGKSIDHLLHQKTLLLEGVMNPASPEGGRQPLFAAADIDKVMQIGASKVAEIIDAIERLSKLGRYAASAEGNSAPAPTVAGSSG